MMRLLGQIDFKELVKVPCGYRWHSMHGSRSRKVTKGHFLLRGYATLNLVIIFHGGSDGHGYISPKLIFLLISVYLKHENSFIPYVN